MKLNPAGLGFYLDLCRRKYLNKIILRLSAIAGHRKRVNLL